MNKLMWISRGVIAFIFLLLIFLVHWSFLFLGLLTMHFLRRDDYKGYRYLWSLFRIAPKTKPNKPTNVTDISDNPIDLTDKPLKK